MSADQERLALSQNNHIAPSYCNYGSLQASNRYSAMAFGQLQEQAIKRHLWVIY